MNTQILTFEINLINGKGQPIYCPFTGEMLVQQDPFDESINESNYPSSVMAVWAGDIIDFEGVSYKSKSFNIDFEEGFSENVETVEDLAQSIDDISNSPGFIIIDVSVIGLQSGDYGRMIFLLGRPVLVTTIF